MQATPTNARCSAVSAPCRPHRHVANRSQHPPTAVQLGQPRQGPAQPCQSVSIKSDFEPALAVTQQSHRCQKKCLITVGSHTRNKVDEMHQGPLHAFAQVTYQTTFQMPLCSYIPARHRPRPLLATGQRSCTSIAIRVSLFHRQHQTTLHGDPCQASIDEIHYTTAACCCCHLL